MQPHLGQSRPRRNTPSGVLDTSKTPSALITHVARQIAELLNIDDCNFVSGAGPGTEDAALHHDGNVTRPGHRVNVERDGLLMR
jgi:hypothetical protein